MQDLVSGALTATAAEAEGALTAVLIWLRFSSSRLLTWNRNYNIKPREISTAQVGELACFWTAWRLAPTAASIT